MNNFEIFMIVISTPFILAALFVMIRKHIKSAKQSH